MQETLRGSEVVRHWPGTYALLLLGTGTYQACCRATSQFLFRTPSVASALCGRLTNVERSLATEKKVQSITDALRGYIQVLTFYQTTSLVNLRQPKAETKGPEPIFTVPFERDLRYIDRSEITSQLHTKLQRNHRAALAGTGGGG